MSKAKIQSVGIVCHFPPPPGGMPSQAEALFRGLESEEFYVVRIATNLGHKGLAGRLEKMRAVRTIFRAPVFLFRLAAALPKVRILHVLSCSGLSFLLFTAPAVLLGVLFGRRVVLHYHGGAARQFFARWRRLVRIVCRCATRIIVPSTFLREIFAELGLEAAVVPNICETDRFAGRNCGIGIPQFIVARHLEPIYNVSCILKAFRHVLDRKADARLYVLGGGSEERSLKILADDLGITRAVTFFGYVDNERLPEMYQNASIFVNASLVDNQPVSILEAYAAGLPVITSAVGGIPDIVENGRTGLFFNENDPADLAEKMLLLVDQPALAHKLAKNGLDKASEFRWQSVYRSLETIYDTSGTAGKEELAAVAVNPAHSEKHVHS